MHKVWQFLLFVTFVITSLLISQTHSAYSLDSIIQLDTPARQIAKVYIPAHYESHHKWPLVLLLHGSGTSGKVENLYLSLSSYVNSRGFILIVPEGTRDKNGQQFWNATDACCDDDHSNVDDEGYLLSLIEMVKKKYSVDHTRVYLIGHSNGGYMAYRMACHAAPTFAAIASLAGATFFDESKCNPSEPVSILEIHALDDSVVHYEGGVRRGISYPGAVRTTQQWLNNNQCQPDLFNDVGPFDLTWSIPGKDTNSRSWTSCSYHSEVALWTINAYRGHYAHAPWLNPAFTGRILDFLFAHHKGNERGNRYE